MILFTITLGLVEVCCAQVTKLGLNRTQKVRQISTVATDHPVFRLLVAVATVDLVFLLPQSNIISASIKSNIIQIILLLNEVKIFPICFFSIENLLSSIYRFVELLLFCWTENVS